LLEARFSVQRPADKLLGGKNVQDAEKWKNIQALAQDINYFMLFQNSSDHLRLRKLVHKALTTRIIGTLSAMLQAQGTGLLAPQLPLGQMEIIADVAQPLVFAVLMDLLHIPPADWQRFRQWLDSAPPGWPGEDIRRALTIHFEMIAYLHDLVLERQARPADDLISVLATISNDGQKLMEIEIIEQCYGLLISGYKTTIALIANGMLTLLNHPQLWQTLREQDSLLESAVEEFLRYDSPLQFIERTAHEHIYLEGQVIQAGERVVLWLGAANRDPVRFSLPDKIDLVRQQNQHLAFGRSAHNCLGAALARLIGQLAFKTLLHSLKDVRLATSSPLVRYPEDAALRTVQSLPIAFSPAL
jgi:cytochrome P450